MKYKFFSDTVIKYSNLLIILFSLATIVSSLLASSYGRDYIKKATEQNLSGLSLAIMNAKMAGMNSRLAVLTVICENRRLDCDVSIVDEQQRLEGEIQVLQKELRQAEGRVNFANDDFLAIEKSKKSMFSTLSILAAGITTFLVAIESYFRFRDRRKNEKD